MSSISSTPLLGSVSAVCGDAVAGLQLAAGQDPVAAGLDLAAAGLDLAAAAAVARLLVVGVQGLLPLGRA